MNDDDASDFELTKIKNSVIFEPIFVLSLSFARTLLSKYYIYKIRTIYKHNSIKDKRY